MDDLAKDLTTVKALQRKHKGIERELAPIKDKVSILLNLSINFTFFLSFIFYLDLSISLPLFSLFFFSISIFLSEVTL